MELGNTARALYNAVQDKFLVEDAPPWDALPTVDQEQWKDILEEIGDFAEQTWKKAYNAGYEEGEEDAKDQMWEDSYEAGYEAGLQINAQGYDEGYEEGYADGHRDGVEVVR